MPNIRSLNAIARKDDLVLIKGEGYFYWWGLTTEMMNKCALLETTSVYVYRFSHLPYERWLEELEVFKKQLQEKDDLIEKLVESVTLTVSNTFVVVYKGLSTMMQTDRIYATRKMAEDTILPEQKDSFVVITLDEYLDAIKSERYDEGYADAQTDGEY